MIVMSLARGGSRGWGARYNKCEFSAPFAWCRALERLLNQDAAGAEKALRVARQQSPFVEAYIKGEKRLPKTLPDSYSPGSKEEAACHAKMLHHAWTRHPKAVEWLGSQQKSK